MVRGEELMESSIAPIIINTSISKGLKQIWTFESLTSRKASISRTAKLLSALLTVIKSEEIATPFLPPQPKSRFNNLINLEIHIMMKCLLVGKIWNILNTRILIWKHSIQTLAHIFSLKWLQCTQSFEI